MITLDQKVPDDPQDDPDMIPPTEDDIMHIIDNRLMLDWSWLEDAGSLLLSEIFDIVRDNAIDGCYVKTLDIGGAIDWLGDQLRSQADCYYYDHYDDFHGGDE